MTLNLPDFSTIPERLMPLESSFGPRTQSIGKWVDDQHRDIKENLALTEDQSDGHDMQVLRIFIRDLLMRNIVGEGGNRIHDALRDIVQTKNDLIKGNFEGALKQARYRWVKDGSNVIMEVVGYFRDKLCWNWQEYLQQAERAKEWNFPDDPLLKIKNIKFKVRDLTLSNFNSNYAAFDLHVTRVVSRIGLVAYGWELTADPEIDFGTNPSNKENYLFHHRLFRKLASISEGRFTPVDLDRIFWHLGRCKCRAATECATCPIRDECLTGRQKCSKSVLNALPQPGLLPTEKENSSPSP
jgi:endonuclease III